MTTTATNTSTAIVSVPRSNGTSIFRNRKMIATLVAFIVCGVAAMVSSPSLQTSARSLLSFTEKRPVPEPTFQERLQSQWSSLFTPLTTTADLQETKVVLPFLKTTVRVPFLTLLQPEPQPEPTITETINAFFQTTAQQISSCSSSSYIACAIHIKDSVVTTMTTAGDKKKYNNNYFFSNEKTNTVASSYTACAIRVKDSVVKNCHDFFLKFVTSSETSAGVNKWAWVFAVGFVAVFVSSTGGIFGLSNMKLAVFVVVVRVFIHWIWVVVALFLAAFLIFTTWCSRERYARDAKIDEINKLLGIMQDEVCDEWTGLIREYYERKYGRPPTWKEFYKNWYHQAGPWKRNLVERARKDPFIVNGSTDATAFVESFRRKFERDVVYAMLDTLDPRYAIVPYNQ
mmetsp:Transcript_29830/g.72268  ORF Transcript_29830/g.72268 Transcript_29830/m.72268 type:complete len:400 (+) Transcript_29830:546-1745(+)